MDRHINALCERYSITGFMHHESVSSILCGTCWAMNMGDSSLPCSICAEAQVSQKAGISGDCQGISMRTPSRVESVAAPESLQMPAAVCFIRGASPGCGVHWEHSSLKDREASTLVTRAPVAERWTRSHCRRRCLCWPNRRRRPPWLQPTWRALVCSRLRPHFHSSSPA